MTAGLTMRKTEQRACIREVISHCPPHSSADEVYRRVREILPAISLATVYRNLELLARQGLIRRLGNHGWRRRYDADLKPHGHFWCLSCGAVEDVPFAVGQPALDSAHPWMSRRVVYTGSTDFQGLCPRCARRTGEAGAAAGEVKISL
jgi:Fe2+ or Zn2+ uptake regulation protein